MRKVAFLALPEFSNLALAAAIEPLFVANWLAQRTVFEWKVVSADGASVRASSGCMIAVAGDLTAAVQCKTVFVIASFDSQSDLRDLRVLRWLKRSARFGVEIGGIENGSLVLAHAGLLNGSEVAVHWDNLIGFQQHYPKTRVLPQLFCRSGTRITCAGASATLDMMLSWIGWHGEADLASEVAEHLLFGAPRAAETPQRMASAPHAGADTVVLRAQAIMAGHVEEPLSCKQIANRVGLSLRQIERRFRDELNCSVLQHYLQIRMAKAHQLLQQTPLSVTDVTFACGFSSPEYFSRSYRKQFGCLPSRDRRQSISAPVMRRSSLANSKRRATQRA